MLWRTLDLHSFIQRPLAVPGLPFNQARKEGERIERVNELAIWCFFLPVIKEEGHENIQHVKLGIQIITSMNVYKTLKQNTSARIWTQQIKIQTP